MGVDKVKERMSIIFRQKFKFYFLGDFLGDVVNKER